MSPTPYEDVLASNVRAARSRAGLQQQALAARMRSLGYTAWIRQTIANVEKGKRRVTAGEVFGLSEALGTSIGALMSPVEEDKMVDFPSGQAVTVAHVRLSVLGRNDGEVKWSGDDAVFPGPAVSAAAAAAYIESMDPVARMQFERLRDAVRQPEDDPQ